MSALPNDLPAFSGDPTGAGAIFAGPAAAAAPDADPSAVVARLNALLRGEIAAAETYAGLLGRMADPAHAPADPATVDALTTMQAEHGRSADRLRGRIADLGGTPTDTSGLWGVWAQAVQGTLTLFAGDAGGVHAIREGEAHGLNDYGAALNAVDAVTAQLIQDRLVPAQERHLATLDELLLPPAADR